MSDLYWLTDEQMARLSPYFPKSHGKPRVDDRRALRAIPFVTLNGPPWAGAPREYRPPKMRMRVSSREEHLLKQRIEGCRRRRRAI